MKRINFTLFVLMVISILFSCTKATLNYTQSGNWVIRTSFGASNGLGVGVGYPACFVIGDNAYVGTGVNPQNAGSRMVSMFKYTTGDIPNVPGGWDSASADGVWTAIANFPGQPRSNAVGFAIGGTGYIGSGLANDGVTPLADFYSYNPGSDSWSQIDSIHDADGSYPRFDAVAFGFPNAGYVLTGTDGFNYFNDFWKYDPVVAHWTRQPHIPGNARSGAVTWTYNGQGYLLGGYTPSPQYSSANSAYDFWRFNPAATDTTVTWAKLRNIFNTSSGTFDDGYTNIIRKNGAGFVILGTEHGDKGYITLGSSGGAAVNFTWEYDFLSDTWNEKTPYEGSGRTGAVGFTVKNRGFVACGLNQGANQAYTDCTEFFPNQVENQFD